MEQASNETHQRILDIAEALFMARGYTAVRLRDIAEAIGVKHAALYYYAPRGKEQLYVQVIERSMYRHRAGMEQAISAAGSELREQLRAVAAWLLTQPAVDLGRLGAVDFPAIGAPNAQRLGQLIYDSIRLPLQSALEWANAEGTAAVANPGLAAMTFVTVVELLHSDSDPVIVAHKHAAVEQLIDMTLYGWLAR